MVCWLSLKLWQCAREAAGLGHAPAYNCSEEDCRQGPVGRYRWGPGAASLSDRVVSSQTYFVLADKVS